MLRSLVVALLILAAAPASAQEAPDAEQRAVLTEVDRLFAAMAARDGAAVAAMVEPEGRVTSVSTGADGAVTIGSSSWAEFAAALGRAPAPVRERIFAPEVRVRGGLAMVWARYDLHVGDAFSHCGTDLFEFVRREGRWRMLHASFTRERSGCEPG